MFKKSSETAPPTAFRMESDTRPTKGTSVLGPTLTFRGGELSVDEDLIIEGTVEGKIAHHSHHLTIGKQGRVKADVRARLITVYGTVEGDLHGDEGVHIAATRASSRQRGRAASVSGDRSQVPGQHRDEGNRCRRVGARVLRPMRPQPRSSARELWQRHAEHELAHVSGARLWRAADATD